MSCIAVRRVPQINKLFLTLLSGWCFVTAIPVHGATAACTLGQQPVSLAGVYAPLPKPVTSFGAAQLDGQVYFFGGHSGPAHQYSDETTLGTLWRLPLQSGGQWMAVAEGTPAQGASLVAWQQSVIRVGGLAPQNKADEKEELLSLANVSRWLPADNRWLDLPLLPEPRSSHDSTVLKDKLFVGGGWQMKGREGSARWADTMAILDLSAKVPVWQSLPQPFKRRALAAATCQDKIYFIGGMDAQSNPSQAVDIYDPATGVWSLGPELPKATMNGFGCAATELDGKLYVSTFSGVVHRLAADGKSWEEAGKLTQGRFFHRLIPHQGKLLVLGGASRRERIKEIEVFTPAKATASPNWPGFRGDGSSIATARNLPLQWNEQDSIRWRSELPGPGQSSPVVWGDTVYLTSVVGARKETLLLTAHDLATGVERWRFATQSSQPEEDTDMRSKAAPTPAAASEGVYILFESGDVAALKHNGKIRWQRSLTKDLGSISGNHGAGASPVLTKDSVIILLDQKTPSLLLALSRADGTIRWQTSREGRVSWSTPLVVEKDGHELVIVSASGDVRAYDATNGKEQWKLAGLQRNLTPSPTLGMDRLLIASSQKGSNLALAWTGGQPPEIAWEARDATSGFGSPLIHQGRAYFVSSIGVLSCHEALTGRRLFEERLPDGCWASPVGAADHVFFFGSKGTTLVLKAADSFQPVATNTLPADKQVHGVAAVEGAWLIRSNRQLLCIGTPAAARP